MGDHRRRDAHSRPDGESGPQTVHCAPSKESLLIHTLRPVALRITHEFVIFISAEHDDEADSELFLERWRPKVKQKHFGDYLFESRGRPDRCISTRQYSRLVSSWIAGIGLDPRLFGTHSLRRTKATLIYRRTGICVPFSSYSAIPKSRAQFDI